MRIVTLNIRGLQGAQAWYDTQALAADYSIPDVIALTETKQLRKTSLHGPMKQLYATYSSTTTDGHAGVVLLVARKYLRAHMINNLDIPRPCQGYLAHITVQRPVGSKLHIMAVYMPVTDKHAPCREQVYEHLSRVLHTLPKEDTMLITGDWNAALQPEDRQSGHIYPLDKQHARWATTHPELISVYTMKQNREPTYSIAGLGDSPSMIDDTMLWAGPLDKRRLVANTEIHRHHGYGTDHAVLVTDLDYKQLELPAMLTKHENITRLAKPENRLETPVTKDDQEAFQLGMLEAQATEILALETKLQTLVTQDARPFLQEQRKRDGSTVHKLEILNGRAAREVIDELAHDLMELLTDAHSLATHVCRTKTSNPSGVHYKPKAIKKKRRKLMDRLKQARALRAQALTGVAEDPTIRDFIKQATEDAQNHARQSNSNVQRRLHQRLALGVQR